MVVVAVSLREQAEKADQFRRKHGLTFPVAIDPDGSFFNRFGQRGIPTNILIRPDGTISFIQAGFNLKGIEAGLKEILPALSREMIRVLLADSGSPDPEMRKKVTRLLQDLDADKWDKRENAEKELEEIGFPFHEEVARYSKESGSPEVEMRVERLLHRWGPMIDARRRGLDRAISLLVSSLGTFPKEEERLVRTRLDRITRNIRPPSLYRESPAQEWRAWAEDLDMQNLAWNEEEQAYDDR